jgi:TolA-binding protein
VPRPMSFKATDVIYFRGDMSDKIYILKSGRIGLNSTDIETGQETHDYIQTGEFFGVKSALGQYPREEDAHVLQDANVIMFTVPEFEQVASQNTRVITKMLKVFSNQLRRMHAKVSALLANDEQVDPEEGLFHVGEYYLGKKRYEQALYVFRRYLTYYPSGRHHARANEYAQKAEQYGQQYGAGKGPNIGGLEATADPVSKPDRGRQLSDVAKSFYSAVSTFSQQDYKGALAAFKEIAEHGADEEYRVKSLFEMGRCYFSLRQFDACVKHFTGLIQRYPKMPELPDALYYVGQSYQEKGDTERAQGFYNKIMSMSGAGEALLRKVRRAMKAIGA